ncbi:MAG: lipase secretion chaperone [Pseudomonadota bacterium]
MTARRAAMKLSAGALAAGLLYASFSSTEPAATPAPRADADPFAFVRSMEGTVPDGAISLGAEGQLVVDAELGHLFDYYLAGIGEKDLNAIRTEIERELERRLKPGAAAQAKLLLGRYLAYKGALVNVEQGLKDGGDMAATARARMAARQKLRQAYFSAGEIAGLFGFTDAYDADAVARIEISQDPKLSAQQRADKLAALDARLSPAMREERDAPTRVVRTEEAVQTMRAAGASDDDVYRLRSAAFSPEGASRLAELDREEAAWKARIATFQNERAAIPAGQQLALQQLRDKHFTADEQRRLGAYE